MTMQELLKSLDLTDEQITSITTKMKENKMFISSEENLDVRYAKLKEQHDALTKQQEESSKLIEDLKKLTEGQEDTQNKIKEYQTKMTELEEQLVAERTESALKVALLASGVKATDIDYIMFKCKSDADWKPVLDDSGNIKGIDDKIKGLKTQYPNQFEASTKKKIDENKLPEDNDDKNKVTKEDFNKMGYQERLKVYNDNPELYKELSE